MSKKRKTEEDELVTVKVKKPVKDAILELQFLLQMSQHKKFSHSEIIEYALTCIPEIGVHLPDRFKVVIQEGNSKS